MTTAELMVTLAREYPNGVSLDPMSVRLLRQKVPFENWQIEDLKAAMFQLGNGLWFSRDMISDDESLKAFVGQAMEWLMNHRCFSVEQLLKAFCGVFRHIATPEDSAALLRHFGFTIAKWGRVGYFCSLPPPSLYNILVEISKILAELLEEADGTLVLNEIEAVMPHLTTEALEGIRKQFLPEVHAAEVGGMPCWRSTNAIPLPEDFAEKLTAVVDMLVDAGKKVSKANLEFVLDLFYRTHFREEYALTDNGVFFRICAKHYQGGNDVFVDAKKSCAKENSSSVSVRRMRGPNTTFRNLGVSIGAELVFTKNSHITCTVLDDSNKVEYDGRAWAISALANHLLDAFYVNGFSHFSYEGETLCDRRLRLEHEGKQAENMTGKIPTPAVVQEVKYFRKAANMPLGSFDGAGRDKEHHRSAKTIKPKHSSASLWRDALLALPADNINGISEETVWAKWPGMGRIECKYKLADALDADGVDCIAEKKWVSFKEIDGVGYYKFEGIGVRPPPGFKGFVPAELKNTSLVNNRYT